MNAYLRWLDGTGQEVILISAYLNRKQLNRAYGYDWLICPHNIYGLTEQKNSPHGGSDIVSALVTTYRNYIKLDA